MTETATKLPPKPPVSDQKEQKETANHVGEPKMTKEMKERSKLVFDINDDEDITRLANALFDQGILGAESEVKAALESLIPTDEPEYQHAIVRAVNGVIWRSTTHKKNRPNRWIAQRGKYWTWEDGPKQPAEVLFEGVADAQDEE